MFWLARCLNSIAEVAGEKVALLSQDSTCAQGNGCSMLFQKCVYCRTKFIINRAKSQMLYFDLKSESI